MKFDLDDLWIDLPSPRPAPILPSIDLAFDEIFVTDSNFKVAPRLGDFMPVLEVTLVRRGSIFRPRAVFSLS
jgi:hypothetical protein